MKCLGLAVFATLPLTSGLSAATDAALVEILVNNGVISPAQADSLDVMQGVGVDAQLLEVLVANGAITAGQADTLRGGQLAEPDQAVAAVPAEPIAGREEPAEAMPAEAAQAFAARAKEKTTESLTFSGRIQAQADLLDTDYDEATDPDHEANLFLRRVYFGVGAQLTDWVAASFNANFANGADGSGEVEKALIEMELNDMHDLEVGFQKVPFSMEETTSSAKLLTVERSVATRYFTEQLDYGARYTGLYLNGGYDSGAYFTVAVTNPERGNVAASADSNTVAAWTRVGWAGELNAVPVNVALDLGRVEDQREDDLADWVWSLHGSVEAGAFDLAGEVLGGRLEDANVSDDGNPYGMNLLLQWQPSEAWDLVGRYAYLDTDGVGADISDTFRRAPETGSARFDEVQAIYFGGNWYIIGNALKLTAGYEWAIFEDDLTGEGDAESHGIRTRLQLLF